MKIVSYDAAIVTYEPIELYGNGAGGTNPAFGTSEAEQSSGFAIMVIVSLVNKIGLCDVGIISHSRQNVIE